MKLPLLKIFLSILLFLGISQISHSEELNTSLLQAYQLDLNVEKQDYPSKNIHLILEIKSNINSGRATVDWIYNSNIIEPVNGDTDIISLTENNTTIVNKEFKFKTQYKLKDENDLKITAKVSALAFNKNYINLVDNNSKVNSEFEILPLLDEYQRDKNIYNIIINAIYFVIGAIIISIITIIVKRFIDYLNSD